jgi:hypothetical protein
MAKVKDGRQVADQAPCRICGEQLWQHPRCRVCSRFVWCTEPDTYQHRNCRAVI